MTTVTHNDITRDTKVGRPWLVLWQNKNEHWIVRGYRTQHEADRKSAALLTSSATQHCIVVRVLYSESKYEK